MMTANDGGASGPSLQDRMFPDLTCFGCGPANARGLRLKSYPSEDGVIAEFTPWPEHDNGLGFLNGGIICTVMDCHSAAAAFVEAERRGMWGKSGAPMPYVTAGIDVRYLRPTPMTGPVQLRAWAESVEEDQAIVAVSLWADGKERASASALWKRWRPRTPVT